MQGAFQGRHIGDGASATGFQQGGQAADGGVAVAFQRLEKIGLGGLVEIAFGEDQVIIVVMLPQIGVGGDGQQAEMDYQGREIVYVGAIIPSLPFGC